MKHLVEVGCTGISCFHEMLNCGIETRLDIFEPHPKHLEIIQNFYKNFPNVFIHPYAIWKEKGKVKFHDQGVTSFIDGIISPAISNNNYNGNNFIEVDTITFNEFDTGSIDLIDLDIEGSEWYALEFMISRPKIIIIEMEWVKYKNPFFQKIVNWMNENKYLLSEVKDANHLYELT